MKNLPVLGVVAVGLLGPGQVAHSGEPGPPIVWGHYREVQSAALGERRTVLVYLPSDYETSDRTYPVLYELDGTEGAFVHCAAAVWYQSEMAGKVPGHIVVGIRSEDRARDFGERAEAFRRFLAKELIPLVDSLYRTSGFQVLFGQSAGSLFAFEVFLSDPSLFDAYILSSFGTSDAETVRHQEAIRTLAELGRLDRCRLFFAEGTNDPYDPTGTRSRNGRATIALLRSRMPQPSRVKLAVYEDGGHAPFPSVYDALKWLHETSQR